MKVQGYIEIDNVEMTKIEQEEFLSFMIKQTLHYKRLTKGDREYYFCILDDHTKIEDQNIDGITVPGLLTLLSSRNPIINGLWDKNGLPFGQTKTVVYDIDTLELTIEIIGEPTYPFDLDLHLSYTPPDREYDEDGNILSETTVTEFRPLHGFSGWALPQAY